MRSQKLHRISSWNALRLCSSQARKYLIDRIQQLNPQTLRVVFLFGLMDGEMVDGDSNHVRGLLTADVEGIWQDGNEDDIDVEGWEAPSGVVRGDRFRQRLPLGCGESRGVGKDTPKWHFFVGLMRLWSRKLEDQQM